MKHSYDPETHVYESMETDKPYLAYHVTMTNVKKISRTPVGTVQEAIELIKRWIEEDNADPEVQANAFGLLTWDGTWVEWYDRHDRSIMELI